MSVPEMIALACVAAVAVAALAFWAAMIYDCARSMPRGTRERWVWLAIVVLGKLPGALAYYLLVKRPARPAPAEA